MKKMMVVMLVGMSWMMIGGGDISAIREEDSLYLIKLRDGSGVGITRNGDVCEAFRYVHQKGTAGNVMIRLDQELAGEFFNEIDEQSKISSHQQKEKIFAPKLINIFQRVNPIIHIIP